VYKNTLVKLAATAAGMESLHEYLVGPTALTFVSGDVAAAAKALTEQAKATPALVLKGGMMGDTVMSADDLKVLANLPPREVLLANFAGALQAPLVKTAGLLQALPRKFAYGLSALIEQQEETA
jgi:large subunit ribosomal protein L10